MIINPKYPKGTLSKIHARLTGSPKSKIWLAFILVSLIAFFFRFYRLADHPLGLFFDPAINGLDAIRFMQRGGPVIFFPTNGGREALLIYLLIPFIWLFDTTPFAFRLQLAIISLLTVVLLFGFLRDWRLSPHASRLWFATLASLTLAVSYWHIAISRGDQRPLAVPLLSVLVFWFFLKGWSSNQKRWFVLCGLFMGLGFHTYSAARLLPIILAAALLPEWRSFFYHNPTSQIPHPPSRLPAHASRIMLLLLTALIIAAPMLWYFVTHPAQFSARAASVMIWNYLDSPSAILAELGRNLVRVLGFFCCVGSPNAIFGLPGHPGLPLLLTPFLIIGLINALKHWRHLFSRLVALWWLIGIAPAIIAIEAPHPLRMIVALVPTAILVALGLITISRWLQSHIPERSLPLGHPTSHLPYPLLPLALILATLPSTFSAYFVEWTRLPVTQGIYDYGAVVIHKAILEHADDARPIYLPLARFNDPPLLFYLSGTFARQAALSTPPADSAWVIAPEKNERDTAWVRLQGNIATILPPLTAEGQQLIQTALAGNSTQPIQTPLGETVARLAPLSIDPARFVQQPTHPLIATFGPARLIGAAYSATIDPTSGEVPITLFWQAASQMVDDYEVILHLVDDSRQVWGNGTARPNDWAYPTTFWRPGLEIIAAPQKIILETAALAPGRYWLVVALFNPATGQRLPLTGGSSDSTDTYFTGPLKVAVALPPPIPPLEDGVDFGDVAQLSGFKLDRPTVVAGEPLSLTLLWQALRPPPVDYTVFVHLLDSKGNLVAGNDTQPVNNSYPTTIWSPGERILDSHTLPTPDSLSPGQYRLAVGLYYQPTGERLPLYFPDGRVDTAGQLILNQPVIVNK